MRAPLHGIRIIDLSAVVSGPMATGILADQGADVIKIEPPKGDLTRVIGPAQGDISALFASINRGKRSLVLDLKHPAGKAILRELLAGADALVENFRPGALDRLGFSFEVLQQINPRLVCLSIAGFGHSGPMAGYRVYDPVIQAVSGFADAHPDPDTGEPRLLQTLLCDKVTALTAAQALTAALLARGPEGRGQRIELSMLDAALAFARKHLGNKPVTALVFTHSHADHFGGARGVVEITLEVREHNTPARALYEGAGFQLRRA